MTSTYLNPTTDANGQATELVNSSTVVDTTNASDDFSKQRTNCLGPLKKKSLEQRQL